MLKRPANLFLVGPMGAGKSTIGRKLSKLLNMEFIDTDQEIEVRTGADIAWIFDVEGEEGFRVREKMVIDELSQRQGIVLATGGGAIAHPESRNFLAARGVVVYLQASIEQQLQRTTRDKRRPQIQRATEAEKRDEMLRLMAEHEALYREIADIIVSTDSRSVQAVANEVIELLEKDPS